ncbi:hypothetical protein [Methylocella sp.]|uniref:hypothetical protein n=1 Tax=Methylocella sp. TaxID=1978226 RepID=UPI003784D6B1
MNRTRKAGAPAFGDILAGLEGQTSARAEPEPRPAAPRAGSARPRPEAPAGRAAPEKSGPAIDTSWLASAQARARAAQAARAAEAGPRDAASPNEARPSSTASRASFADVEGPPEDAAPDAKSAQDAGAKPADGGPSARARRAPNPVHAMRRLIAGFAATLGRRRRQGPEAASTPPAAPPPAPLDEDAAIARELGLTSNLAIGDLRRIRRDFAKKNHPDRFAPALRNQAARRMTIANMLIDQQLKGRAPPPK